MSLALVTPEISNLSDVGIDRVCKIIQSDLSELDWLAGRSLGRIYAHKDEAGNVVPEIYKGDGEYYPAYPNDELISFSALYPHDDERVSGFGYLKERTLSVIVWVNLRALEVEIPSIEGFKDQVIIRLRELACVSEVGNCYDSSAGGQGIYPGFTLTGLQNQFNTYPYRAFRIETKVNFYTEC